MKPRLKVLGAETLGVRGLACLVSVRGREVLVDPGVALGFSRHGLRPHPIQAAFAEAVKAVIRRAWGVVSDVVVTHLHGDHLPLRDANPFQLSLESLNGVAGNTPTLWVGASGLSRREEGRLEELVKVFRRGNLVGGETESPDGLIGLAGPYSHGLSGGSKVFIVRVGWPGECVAHLSDTQLLVEGVISKVREWGPRLIITDGPPTYRLFGNAREAALRRAEGVLRRLAGLADYVIVDHHVARSIDGLEWLDRVRREVGERVMCAADYEGLPRLPLEAWRRELYEAFPEPNEWFVLREYRGVGEAMEEYGDVAYALLKGLPLGRTLGGEELLGILRELAEERALTREHLKGLT